MVVTTTGVPASSTRLTKSEIIITGPEDNQGEGVTDDRLSQITGSLPKKSNLYGQSLLTW